MKHVATRWFMGLLAATALAWGAAGQEVRLRSPVLVKPMVISGEVSVILGGSGTPVISPYFNIRRGTEPVRNLVVTLNGHKLRETMPGQYAGIRITDITPRPGLRLTFTIEFPRKVAPTPTAGKTVRIVGMAVVGSLASINRPRNKSVLNLKSLGKALAIAWTGGDAPFQVSLLKTTGGSPLEIFSKSGLLGRSCAVPATLLVAPNTYSAGVHYGMGAFSMSTGKAATGMLVSKTSRVVLRCSVFSAFAVN